MKAYFPWPAVLILAGFTTNFASAGHLLPWHNKGSETAISDCEGSCTVEEGKRPHCLKKIHQSVHDCVHKICHPQCLHDLRNQQPIEPKPVGFPSHPYARSPRDFFMMD
jgi:hypothetical protein